MRPWLGLCALCAFALTVGAVAQAPDGVSSWTDSAKTFRERVAGGELDAAREMMSVDPRRWFEKREGPGRPWRIGSAEDAGPWHAWDRHFRTRSEPIAWREGDRWATLHQRETNDYFRLLDRGWVENEITYFFDDQGRIEGLLVAAVGERPPGRTDEFRSWARQNDPQELDYLMPDGEIDPAADRPARFRALLERWRQASSLPAIDDVGGASGE